MDTFIATITPLIPASDIGIVASIVTTLVSVCAVIDMIFPQPAAGSKWVGIRKLISFIGANRGHASNAVPAGMPPTVLGAIQDAAAVTKAIPAAAEASDAAKRLSSQVP